MEGLDVGLRVNGDAADAEAAEAALALALSLAVAALVLTGEGDLGDLNISFYYIDI